MAKGKLIIPKDDASKLKLASKLTDVAIEDNEIIADKIVLIVNYKTQQQLFELGRVIDKIEIKAPAK